MGIDAEYEAVRTAAAEVEPMMRGGEWAGGNVTLPHKPRAARVLERPSADVLATRACNCWWRRPDGELAGDNTDVAGLRLALSRLGFRPRGARVLLLGAGGAARAAIRALLEGGASSIEILNRTPDRARALRDAVPGHAVRVVERPEVAGVYDLVLNATSLGLAPDDPIPLELDPERFSVVFDMVYAAGETRWVRHAHSLGLHAHGGLDMLVGQASRSLERWFPERTPPLAEMRDAGAAALA